MKIKSAIFLFTHAAAISGSAQIEVTRFFNSNQNIPDNGQFLDIRTVENSGFATVTDVNVRLVMQGAAGTAMRLGDYYVSLTNGTASEEERFAVLLNRPQTSDTAPFGSSLSSVDISLDDSGFAGNVFHISSNTGTYKADGRLSVDPYGAPVAYDSTAVTHGLSTLNGSVFSNTWGLLVADTRQGAAGKLLSWTLSTTGISADSGSIDPGPGGTIADTPGGIEDHRNLKSILLVSGSGAAGVTADVSESLFLSGGLSGAGELHKIGTGRLTLGGDSTGSNGGPSFSGTVVVGAGEVEIAASTALGLHGALVFHGNHTILRLSTAAAFERAIAINAGTEVTLEGSGTLSGTISGEGGLRKEGPGKITLDGDNSYLGDTVISGGVLAIDGSMTSSIHVEVGGVLKGSGLIHGAVNVSGQLVAGSSVGTLGTGPLTFRNDSMFAYEMDLASFSRGFVQVAGDFAIENGAVLTLTEQGGTGVSYGTKFTLIRYSGAWDGGLFAHDGTTLADNSVIQLDSSPWLVQYADGSEGFTLTSVPEPAAAVISSLTFMGLLMRRRR